MTVDQTTLEDLSLFSHHEEQSLVHHLDHTISVQGREMLRKMLMNPLNDIEKINQVQRSIQAAGAHPLPQRISNGTLMVITRFYETAFGDIPQNPGRITAFTYKLFRKPEYSLLKYSIGHCIDMVVGMHEWQSHFTDPQPQPLQKILDEIRSLLQQAPLEKVLKIKRDKPLPPGQFFAAAHFFRFRFKRGMQQLMDIYAKADAWQSLATAAGRLNLHYPEFVSINEPLIEGEELFHLLLPEPVPYSIKLNKEKNFLFLTSANMAGKSTFIKTIGVAVYLAHIGMAVPARSLRLSLFNGLLTNINVVDNLFKGESYFYNEVQRIADTVKRISDGRRWLILIDELFKGTNVQDAMKCSLTVIEGLQKVDTSIFVLSTHLYEIADSLQQYNNIVFRYFETTLDGEKPIFHYKLLPGVSQDRLGFLILKQSGIVEMLRDL